MDWSNWLYLAVGLGLGIGGCLLFGSRRGVVETPPNEPEQSAKLEVQALREQLKQTQLAYQMACQMSQFKAGFLGRTAHELRSPLNGLIGAIELILGDLCDDPAEEREFLAKAQASALKIVEMLDVILEVARLENGRTQMQVQPLQLLKVLDEVYRLTHLQAADRNIYLEVIPPDPEIYILADPKRLRQVLVHLVDAAISPLRSGSIFVSASADLTRGQAAIWIDSARPEAAWSEMVDLLRSPPPASDKIDANPQLSPGMIFLLDQTLLELMEGRLEILPVPGAPPSEEGLVETADVRRIQCSLPLLIPEPESD